MKNHKFWNTQPVDISKNIEEDFFETDGIFFINDDISCIINSCNPLFNCNKLITQDIHFFNFFYVILKVK